MSAMSPVNGGTPLPDCSCDCPDMDLWTGLWGCFRLMAAGGGHLGEHDHRRHLPCSSATCRAGMSSCFTTERLSAQVEHAADPTNRLNLPLLILAGPDTTPDSFPENLAAMSSTVPDGRLPRPEVVPPQMESGSIRLWPCRPPCPGSAMRFQLRDHQQRSAHRGINGRCFQPFDDVRLLRGGRAVAGTAERLHRPGPIAAVVHAEGRRSCC